MGGSPFLSAESQRQSLMDSMTATDRDSSSQRPSRDGALSHHPREMKRWTDAQQSDSMRLNRQSMPNETDEADMHGKGRTVKSHDILTARNGEPSLNRTLRRVTIDRSDENETKLLRIRFA
jgi:hypothetical protein